jgi:hypothetical protein
MEGQKEIIGTAGMDKASCEEQSPILVCDDESSCRDLLLPFLVFCAFMAMFFLIGWLRN